MPPRPRNSREGAEKILPRPPLKPFAGRAGWLYRRPA